MRVIAIALALLVWASPAFANNLNFIKTTPTQQNYTPMPTKQKKSEKSAQAIGYICRNGYWYCTTAGYGLVGAPCCGCGFCGVWSLW